MEGKNNYEVFVSTNSENINTTLTCSDFIDVSVLKEETEISKLSNVDPLSETHNECDIKDEDLEHEIEYLDEEFDEEKSRKEDNPLDTCNSYINDLQLQFPELKEDKELLVEVVASIMYELKPPNVPEKYYLPYYGKFKCVMCGAKTDTLPAAERHYQEKHGSRYLVCYACGANFRSRGNLYRHEKKACKGKAKDIYILLKARAMFLARKGQNRPCSPNGQGFTSNDIHNDTIKSSEKYLCSICPTSYVTKQALESHMNKHYGIRPYRCGKCSNAYSGRNALKQHLECHENVKFICHICERPFKWRSSLIEHMNTHLPTKKYECPECDRRYAKAVSLKLHVNKVHKKLPHPYGCLICRKRFAKMFVLKQHMKKEHELNIMSRSAYLRRLPKMSDQHMLTGKIILSKDLAKKDSVVMND